MQHIIFSTCERNGLEQFSPAPPALRLGNVRAQECLHASFCRNNLLVSSARAGRPRDGR